MTIDLTDDEAAALEKRLRRTIDDELYPLVPGLDPLKAILTKLNPPVARPQPLPTLRHPMGSSAGRGEAGMERLTLIAVGLALLLSACGGGGGNAFAGPDPGGGYPCPNNAFEDCAVPTTAR